MKLTKFSIFLFFLLVSIESFSQVSTGTYYSRNTEGGSDVMIGSGVLKNKNFSTKKTLNVFQKNPRHNSMVFRTLLDFDLSNIPENAIIVNATLYLSPKNVNNNIPHPIYIERIKEAWADNTVKWNNQPKVYQSDKLFFPNSVTNSNTVHQFNIKKHIQKMVSFLDVNHGLRLRLKNENMFVPGGFGMIYHSSEATNSSFHPKLIVEYVLPIEVTTSAQHCSTNLDNGSISIVATGGSSNYATYNWYKYDMGVVTQIHTGTTPADATLGSLTNGLYLVEVIDDNNIMGYKYILLGKEGVTTTVQFHDSNSSKVLSKKHNEDALLKYFYTTNQGSRNYKNSKYIDATDNARRDFYVSSLLKYNVDFDTQLEFSNANLSLNSNLRGHLRQNSTVSNTGYISRITSNWDESIVTWNRKPTISTTDQITVTETIPVGLVVRNDNFDILNYVQQWQNNPTDNNGIELSLQTYGALKNSKLSYYSYDAPGINKRPIFELSFDVKQVLTATYDETKEEGTITVNAPQGELPYTYLLSYASIPDMNTMWLAIKDSTGIDSVYFFSGKENTKTYEFTGLISETYYVAVFDNNGQEIYQGKQFLGSSISPIQTTTNVIIDNNTYTLDSNSTVDGFITMDGAITKNANGLITIKLESMGAFRLGFNKMENTTSKTVNDYLFGLKMSATGGLELFREGIFLNKFSVNIGDELTLSKNGSDFIFYKNGLVMYTEKIIDYYYEDLKTEFTLTRGPLLVFFTILEYIKKPRVPISFETFQDIDCNTEMATLSWYLNKYNYGVDPSSITVNVEEIGGNNSYLNISPGQTFVNEGVYLVTVSWIDAQGIPRSITYQFVAGNKIIWNIIDNLVPVSNTVNSIRTSGWWSGITGNAVSSNYLEDNTDGWVSSNVKTYSRPQPIGSIQYKTASGGFGSIALKNENNEQVVLVKLTSMGYGVTSKFVQIYSENSLVTSFVMNGEGTFKIDKTGNTITVYDRNNVLRANFTTTITGNLKVYAQANSSIIYNTFSSFCSGLTNDNQCGYLDYELNGNYYYTNTGRFCFVYNEEYNDSNIKFNIYNINNNLVATENDFNLLPLIFGENRVILDLSQIDCMSKGYFVLEVINDKGENFYLRFYNDSSFGIGNLPNCYYEVEITK